jgi:GDPmannose 4,6-dehydratase
MLNRASPDDYILPTEKSHTLLEFVETAFGHISKDWHDRVMIDDALMRPTDILRNKFDPSKAARGPGWRAKSDMTEVVGMMLEAEVTNLHKEEAV